MKAQPKSGYVTASRRSDFSAYSVEWTIKRN